MVTRSNLKGWVIVYYCVLKINIIDCYGNKHKILDGNILRDHGSGSNWPWYRVTIFIAVFKEVGGICTIKSNLRKHKYHQILQRRTTLSLRKAYVEDDLQTLFGLSVWRRYENENNLVLMRYFLINLLKFIKFKTISNILKKKSSG